MPKETVYFLIQDEKGPILITWKTRVKSLLQSFWTSILSKRTGFGFSMMIKISARIKWWTHVIAVKLFCLKNLSIVRKTKHRIMVFGLVTSDSDIIPPFIFPLSLTVITEPKIKCLGWIVLSLIARLYTYIFIYNQRWNNSFAQSAGAVEYTDCFSAEG